MILFISEMCYVTSLTINQTSWVAATDLGHGARYLPSKAVRQLAHSFSQNICCYYHNRGTNSSKTLPLSYCREHMFITYQSWYPNSGRRRSMTDKRVVRTISLAGRGRSRFLHTGRIGWMPCRERSHRLIHPLGGHITQSCFNHRCALYCDSNASVRFDNGLLLYYRKYASNSCHTLYTQIKLSFTD